MDANLEVKSNLGFRQILLKKLSCAIVASITSQVGLLFLYIFILNCDVFHPLNWLKSFLTTLTSFYTWIYLIPFATIIFAQTVICAKDYVIVSRYSSSRFMKFISIFSIHNFVLLILHIVSGALVVWLYLALSGGRFSEFIKTSREGKNILVEGKLYLILCGFWSGLYYFLNMYASDKKIMFPVVYQYKLLQFKSQFFPIIRRSKSNALLPTIYFMVFYYFFGNSVRIYFCKTFALGYEEESNVFIYLCSWLFTTLYFVKMRLMSLFFELFLTEPIYFPVETVHKDEMTLSEGMGVNSVPIIQHLACYDLYMLSFWCPNRRKQYYSLSQPGGHPHNWNTLLLTVLKLINEYTQELNKSTTQMLEPDRKPIAPVSVFSPPQPRPITSPQETRFRNLRNMSYREPEPLDIINVTHGNINTNFAATKEPIMEKITLKMASYISTLKSKLGINFFFGELPEASIQHALANGQIIIWTSQGLSSLVCFAIKEDLYGVVQKDLPVIISTLYELKMSLEKLNRLPSLSKRASDDYNVKMKVTINAAVRRSIFNICRTYWPHLKELNLKRDIAIYLQNCVNARNCA